MLPPCCNLSCSVLYSSSLVIHVLLSPPQVHLQMWQPDRKSSHIRMTLIFSLKQKISVFVIFGILLLSSIGFMEPVCPFAGFMLSSANSIWLLWQSYTRVCLSQNDQREQHTKPQSEDGTLNHIKCIVMQLQHTAALVKAQEKCERCGCDRWLSQACHASF